MPKLPVTVNLSAYHGDTWRQTFRFLKNDAPIDLSSVVIASSALRRSSSGVSSLGVVIEPDPGMLTLSLPPGILPGKYWYDIQITESNGDVKTWVRGELTIEKDVTNVT